MEIRNYYGNDNFSFPWKQQTAKVQKKLVSPDFIGEIGRCSLKAWVVRVCADGRNRVIAAPQLVRTTAVRFGTKVA